MASPPGTEGHQPLPPLLPPLWASWPETALATALLPGTALLRRRLVTAGVSGAETLLPLLLLLPPQSLLLLLLLLVLLLGSGSLCVLASAPLQVS